MANEEQLAILKRGVWVWNQWRGENPEVQIDLTGADLMGVNLRDINLSGADLRSTKFTQANLTEANLRRADLMRADLYNANLERADLYDANLEEANLTRVDLIGARLGSANLREANLTEAILWQSVLIGANLTRANLTGAILDQAHLGNANLSGANLRGASLSGTKLYDANLEGVDLRDVDLRWVFRKPGGHETDLQPSAPQLSNLLDPMQVHPDEVSFTAIYPKVGKAETWHTLLVYAHLLSALGYVSQDARRFKDQIPAPKEVSISSSTPIARGTEISIVPSCDEVVFNPERVVVKWMEDYHRADFRFKADSSLADDAARGQINIYAGPIMIGTLKFAMLFHAKDTQNVADHAELSRMFYQEEIFISYSHKDTDIVLACKKAYEALGFNILIDVDSLRSGQVWNEELMYMIDRATIFQLFWSQNSAQSKYCRQEWEHALKRNKDGFIRPCYWEKPIPEPPEELSKYHFEYMQLK